MSRFSGHFLLFLALFSTFVSPSSLAWPPLFGPEFTFTNPEIAEAGNKELEVKTPVNLAKLREWQALIKKRCESSGNCKVSAFRDKHGPAYRVKFNDGWYYNISVDMAALEVQTKPGTIEDFRAHQELIQSEIFDTAKSIGIIPHERIGQGHIHIGLQDAFEGDSQLFRNFVVDYSNRPELAWGALGNHLGNSPPLAALTPEQKRAFAQVVRRFDEHPTTIRKFSREISQKVYTASTVPEWGGPEYFQALRFMDTPGTVEMRGFRPQRNAEEFIKEIELLQARLEYLKKLDKPIAYSNPPTHELSPQEIVTRFKEYVTESGLDWERYRTLLPPKYANVTPDPGVEKALQNASPVKVSKPYDEVRDESGKLRDVYRDIYNVYESMTPQQRQAFEQKTWEEAAENRKILPLPRLLTLEEHAQILAAAAQRAKALRLLLEDVSSGNYQRIEQLGLPKHVVDDALKRSYETQWVSTLNHGNIAFSYGPDIIRDANGHFRVIEDNVGNVGGLGDSNFSREQLLTNLPAYRPFLEQDQGRSGVEIMVDHFRKIAIPPNGEIVILVHPSSADSNVTLSKQFTDLGAWMVSDTNKIRADSNGAYILVDGQWKRIGVLFPKNFDLKNLFETTLPGLKQAMLHDSVAFGSRPGMAFLGDKEITPYVENLIRGYLHEEPILTVPKTRNFFIPGDQNSQIDLDFIQEVIKNRFRWVIKRADGGGGGGVFIGEKHTESDWRRVVLYAKASPRDYIVQELTQLSEFEGNIVDIRPITYVSRAGVDVADQLWGRATPTTGDGKVNVSISGKVTAVFAVDPAKYPNRRKPSQKSSNKTGKSCVPQSLAEKLR